MNLARAIPFVVFFSFLVFPTLAQKGYSPGYIVTHLGDTVHGSVKDRSPGTFTSIYDRIRFKGEEKKSKKKYGPNDILGYKSGARIYESIGIALQTQFFKTRYRINPAGDRTFLRVMHKGRLSYYLWEYIDEDNDTVDDIPLFHLQGSNEMVRATQGIFGLKRKKLVDYFGNCPGLVDRILSKEIRTAEGVVKAYEYYCEQ